MRLIKPSFEIIEQETWSNSIYKQIEIAGRTCYKSEDRIVNPGYWTFTNSELENILQGKDRNGEPIKGEKDYSRFLDYYNRGMLVIENVVWHDESAKKFIYEGTSKPFVKRLIDSGHLSVLEHGTVYLYLPPQSPINFYKYRDNKYSVYREVRAGEKPYPLVHCYVTTNYRVLVENNWLDDLKYMCKPTEHHEKRVTVKFICDRGVSHKKFVA